LTTCGRHSPTPRVWPVGTNEVEGDLRLDGEYRARLFASGWEGTGRIEACEPPRRLPVVTKHAGEAEEQVIEISLTADGDQTIVVWEERGMPLDLLSAYGAGVQIHVEDLADYLARRERRDDAKARWDQLHPAYQHLATNLG
jgi:Activator of Hsp90 ATPase homolog 1-like protein